MDTVKKVNLPLTAEAVKELKAGDNVLLNGTMYVARDAAHKRMVAALDNGDPLPFDVKGEVIYFMGPTPPRPGQVNGSPNLAEGFQSSNVMQVSRSCRQAAKRHLSCARDIFYRGTR